jgi:molybdate transport system ATP-binding protein
VLRADLDVELGRFRLVVDLDIDGVQVVMGPNGSGKSTLLRTLVGAVTPRAGSIRLGGRVLYDAEQGIDRPPEARRVALVPQDYGLFPHLSVLDNVAYGAPRGKLEQRRSRAARVLGDLELTPLADRRPTTLSGGQRQRVALARAVAMEPEAILLDEPLAALDLELRPRVRGFLREWLLDTRLPCLVVTHDPRDAVALSRHLLVLEEGHVVAAGAPQDLASRPANAFIAALGPDLLSLGRPEAGPRFAEPSEDE